MYQLMDAKKSGSDSGTTKRLWGVGVISFRNEVSVNHLAPYTLSSNGSSSTPGRRDVLSEARELDRKVYLLQLRDVQGSPEFGSVVLRIAK